MTPKISLTIFLVGTLLALSGRGLHGASATETWVHRLSNVVSNAEDVAHKVVVDARGDLVVIGSITDDSSGSDFLTLKYSGVDGSLLWQRRYDGPAHGSDVPSGVALDLNGDVVVTGSSADARGYPDIYTVKYAAADGTLRWERRYNGPANTWDDAHALAVDARGDVVVTGYSHNESYPDIYTAKYAAATGALLWEKRYNSTNDSWDEARAAALDKDGNVIIAGFTTKADGYQDLYAAKYAAVDGRQLWEKRYRSPHGSHSSAYAVAIDPSGNVAVVGSSGGTPQGYYTAKFAAADGTTLWENRYTGAANEGGVALAVAVDSSGAVVATGVTFNSRTDGYTVKYAAADGALLWERSYAGPIGTEDRTHAVALDPLGNVLVTGYADRGSGTQAYYTAKYAAADGALLWERRYNSPASGEDQGTAVAVDPVGHVLVTGFSHGVRFDSDIYTAKYQSGDGALLWENRYRGGAGSEDRSQTAAVDSRGDVVMAGISSTDRQSDSYAAKYAAADGALVWEWRHHDPAHVFDQSRAVAVDARGDVAVSGYSWQDADHYAAKYAGADGALLWQRRYRGVVLANDMAIDSGGNVVVAGYSLAEAGFTNANFYTAKYAAADGRLLWEHSSLAYQAEVVAVAVDANGNVAVTGPFNGWNSAFYTAKYASATGELLWEKTYDGLGSSDDRPASITADAAGNVVVTGTSGDDYYTAKYAAANGALLWDKRYNGPGRGSDRARAVAVTTNGDVVVTGASLGAQLNQDFYTAKYAAGTGALLWERRYNGPANGNDVATAVAVDAFGNVVVTGSSYNNSESGDYLTIKYRGADGALFWEKRYNGLADGEDIPLTPRSLAIWPGGIVAVTGASDARIGAGADVDYATVRYVESPTITPIPNQGGYQLRFPSIPGQRYAVQRARVPSGPWTVLTVLTAPPNGYLLHTDPNPPSGEGFYRLTPP